MSKYSKYRSPDDPKLFCCYCGKWIVFPLRISIEHLIPVSKGGNNKLINKRTCCTLCNIERSNRPLFNWLAELEELLKSSRFHPVHKYDIAIKVENIKAIIDYIKDNGVSLYRNDQLFKQYYTQL
jgi:hypothetical protein